MGYDEIIAELRSRTGALRCADLARLLGGLGFVVRDCGKGNHKAYSHPRLPDFRGGNYDCGHGRNPVVKPVYVRKVIRTLEEWEDHLRRL